jgi:hypothetical protein
MVNDDDVRSEIVEQLQEALEAEDEADKDFHVRQALQFLEVDDDS